MGAMLDAMLFASFMHMMMPPPIMIVHPSGAPIGTADTIKDNPEAVEASAHDPGDADSGHHGDHDDHGGYAQEVGDYDDGGSDFGDDGGGFDGGGFDGGTEV
jgi:hypothetical protein